MRLKLQPWEKYNIKFIVVSAFECSLTLTSNCNVNGLRCKIYTHIQVFVIYLDIYYMFMNRMILEFLGALTEAGHRIFSTEDACIVAMDMGMGIQKKSVHYLMRSLSAKSLIYPVYKGNYAIADHILSGSPIHRFEIAMHLCKDGAIACWSAMSFYELTDQVLSTIYILAPKIDEKKRSLYRYQINGYTYVIIQTQQEHFWGVKKERMGETKVAITDLERTLIDGLIRPNYCGGFREVLDAFAIAKERIDQARLIDYGKRCSIAAQKRLGWVLNQLSFENLDLPIPSRNYFDKLDPAGPRRGKQNTQWMVLENF